MRALITRMDQPLGRAVGNAVEIAECVACLRGDGPADLVELSVELAAEMVLMGGVAPTLDDARDRCLGTITDGSALDRFRRVVVAQGGDGHAIDDPTRLPQAKGVIEVDSKHSRLRPRPRGPADRRRRRCSWARGGPGSTRGSTRPSA